MNFEDTFTADNAENGCSIRQEGHGFPQQYETSYGEEVEGMDHKKC